MHSMRFRPFLLTALLLCVAPIASFAQATGGDENGIRCVEPASEVSERFAGLQDLAQDLNRQVCLALFSNDIDGFEQTQKRLYRDFGLEVIETASDQLGNSNITEWRKPFDGWLDRISTSEFRNKDAREMSVITPPFGRTIVFFGDRAQAAEIGDASDRSCGPQQNERCMDVLRDMAIAVNVYNDSYASFALQSTRRRLGDLSNEWDRFLEAGRSQTLLDLIATTILERSHFKKDYLVGPPKRQWALLHPNLVYEHAEDAAPGERDELGVAIEWIGINWWSDASPLFGMPFGISLASIYSDRPGMESVGHGAMLHIANQYSFGWASRSGDSSYYLTIDLLKFVEDKQQQFDKYKQVMLDFD